MIVRGPFILKWGDNTLAGIEEVDLEHTIDSEDFQTIQGSTYEIDGAYKVTATVTFLETDLASLSAVLPQYFVANGQQLSTGETVSNAQGALDVTPASCDTSLIHNHLQIISCANPADVLRVVDARSKFEGIELDNKVRKVMVKFIGESPSTEATVQFFKQGSINMVS